MCLNQGRPGMPSGLSQLRSTCIMPWLRVRVSLGSMGPCVSFRLTDSFRRLPAASKLSISFRTPLKSRETWSLDSVGELDTEVRDEPQEGQAGKGSFDCVAASLREPVTSLRMTEDLFGRLFLLISSLTNWRMLLA